MKKLIAITSIGFFACVSAHSAEQRISCPAEYPGKDVHLSNVPKGWTAVAPTRLLLTSIFVVLGPPEERGVLKGEHYRLKKKGSYEVRFTALRRVQEYEQWIACSYGSDDIAIAQRLAPGIDQCIVTYTPHQHGAHMIEAVCR